MKKPKIKGRQGDVMLIKVDALPDGCAPIPDAEPHRTVLAHGEVTGHAHAIYVKNAMDIARDALAKATKFAQLFVAKNGDRYLKVTTPVTLQHEEHTAHSIPAGIYKLPVQVEYTPEELRRVED
jgi:hypothetical protein